MFRERALFAAGTVLCLEVDALFGDVEIFLLNAVDELLSKISFFYAPESLLLENHEKRAVDRLSCRRRQAVMELFNSS